MKHTTSRAGLMEREVPSDAECSRSDASGHSRYDHNYHQHDDQDGADYEATASLIAILEESGPQVTVFLVRDLAVISLFFQAG